MSSRNHPSDPTQSTLPAEIDGGKAALSEWLSLDDPTRNFLTTAVLNASRVCMNSLAGTYSLINNIFSGRDHMSSIEALVPLTGFSGKSLSQTSLRTYAAGPWTPPQTMANLIQARVRVITTSLNPGRPTIHVKARLPGDTSHVHDQNRILEFAMDAAGMDVVTREFAQSALMSPYAGIRVRFNYSSEVPVSSRIQLEKVDASNCGWEPGMRRFSWHRYYAQYGDLPRTLRSRWTKASGVKRSGDLGCNPWELVQITEVYHPGVLYGDAVLASPVTRKQVAEGACPTSFFIRKISQTDGDPADSENFSLGADLGHYCGTRVLPACPLTIHHFVTPAPNEDVPPAEVLSWLPPLRGLVITLVAITREVVNTNNVILYDSIIDQAHIDTIQDAPTGSTVMVPIVVDEKGVAQKMRPMERVTALPELTRALEIYYSIFDDVTGVTAMNRGQAENPRKSATEAGALVSASNQRNEDRLKVIAQTWQSVARVIFAYQRHVYGARIKVPIHAADSKGMAQTLTLVVPDPSATKFAFSVDPVELAHMSRRNEVDQLLAWVTIFSNAFLQFRGSIPRIVRESLRRVAFLMGIENADYYLETPVMEAGPEDRYTRYLETRKPIEVNPQDDHVLFIGYYTAQIERAIESGEISRVPIAALKAAVEKHQRFLDRTQTAGLNTKASGSIVPGFGSKGQASSDTAAGLAAGNPASLFPIDQTALTPSK